MKRQQVSITYSNGLTQYFFVISHELEFLLIIKPSRIRLDELEAMDKNQQKKYAIEINTLKSILKEFDFKWCTEKSPIYESVGTQRLRLLPQQGGNHPVVSKFID